MDTASRVEMCERCRHLIGAGEQAHLDDGAIICDACARLPQADGPAEVSRLMPCPDCGRSISRAAGSCPTCGRPIVWVSVVPPKTAVDRVLSEIGSALLLFFWAAMTVIAAIAALVALVATLSIGSGGGTGIADITAILCYWQTAIFFMLMVGLREILWFLHKYRPPMPPPKS